jgi:hypothetical protein
MRCILIFNGPMAVIFLPRFCGCEMSARARHVASLKPKKKDFILPRSIALSLR